MNEKNDELERKKFIKENPETMEIFHNVLDTVFGPKGDNEKNSENEE